MENPLRLLYVWLGQHALQESGQKVGAPCQSGLRPGPTGTLFVSFQLLEDSKSSAM